MNETKKVHLVSSRPRKDLQVEVGPADTAHAILLKAGLDPNDHFIIKPGDQTEFGMDEPVFAHTTEGGKLNVVPQSNVGGATRPSLSSYAQDMGWTTRRDRFDTIVHEGYFRTLGLRWQGRVRESRLGGLQFEIHNPPIAYIRHSKWAGCFHALQGAWMWITFSRPPKDVDSGIAAVNKILQHVFLNRHTLQASR